MWFRPLSVITLVVLATAASVWAQDRPTVAVAFVDVKFDDKAAVWSLLLDQRYSRVIAITSGVHDHGRAAWELEKYLERQNAMANNRFRPEKIQVLRGESPFPDKAPHENWWQGNPAVTKPAASQEELRRALHGNRVRVFQIAPSTLSQVQAVINAADKDSIDSYMLLHGYNSRQANMEWQTYFLRNVRSWLVARHRHAEMYFTSSFDSYAEKNGGKQFISDLQNVFPDQDLKQAIRDPFWSRQLIRAEPAKLTRTPFPISDAEKLDDIIYATRIHPEENRDWREYIAGYIRNVLANKPETEDEHVILARMRHTLLPEFTGRPTLELADAAHMAAFHRYLDGIRSARGSGMYVEPVVYPRGPHEEDSKVPFETATGGEIHGVMLKGANRDLDLGYIKRLAGIH